MTEIQIDLLRAIILGEIRTAILKEKDYNFVCEEEKINQQFWDKFRESFQ
jgi:hypothetical protein